MTESKSEPSYDFSEKSSNTDFTFVAEGIEFHVAKSILLLASPAFKKQTSDRLELKERRAKDLKEFLLAVYPSTTPALSKEQALKVLPFAKEFQVDYLARRCGDVLLGSTDEMTTAEELYRLIDTAHQYNLSCLYKRCIDLVFARPTNEIEKANGDLVLPVVIIKNMISRIKELELSEVHKSEDIETIKAWRKYITTAVKSADVPKIYKENVLGKSLMVTIDIEDRNRVVDHINLSNVNLTIQFYIENERICAQFELNGKHNCNMFIQFVVVNRKPSESHLLVNLEKTVRSGQPQTRCEIAELNKIVNVTRYDKGFVAENKVKIEVNMFLKKSKKD